MSLPRFPQADFDDVIERYTKGAAVIMPLLLYMDFRDTPMGVWGGEFNLSSGGVTWKGMAGYLISVDGLDANYSLDSSDTNVSISGVDATVMGLAANQDRAAYVGRMAGFYAQFCDGNYQPLCPPFAVRAGFMGAMVINRQQKEDGSWVRSVTLPVSNLFAGRGNAPASFYTDRDQQLRYPGDKFFSYAPATENFSFPVPWFKVN